MDRPSVLIVAGYDQSAGAGVLSDVKTLEANGVYGYAALTGITLQHERSIRRVQWLSPEDVAEQIDVCFDSAAFRWVKIGITPSMGFAAGIIDHLRRWNPDIRVILDPVIRASSGKDFWGVLNQGEWEDVAARCWLVTPNWEEMGWLYPGKDVEAVCAGLTSRLDCRIYLKGGHHPASPGRDYLWQRGQAKVFEPAGGGYLPKHGSGCVLSAALTANLALDYALDDAAVRAKRYVEKFLSSNNTLLGWH